MIRKEFTMKKRTAGLAAVVMLIFCLCGAPVFAEEQVPPAGLTFDGFLTDLVSALNARRDLLNQAGGETLDKQTAVMAAQKEWETMGKYAGADSLAWGENEEYLRKEYLDGLGQQAGLTPDEPDDSIFWKSWDEGYLKRAYVLEELYAIYYLSGIPDEVTSRLGDMTGGYAENNVPEVFQLQVLVNVDADGQTGKKTILALKKKQEELGLEINGVVNGFRVEELVQKLMETGQEAAVDQANERLLQEKGEAFLLKKE